MLLGIDIGNTNITIGLFDDSKLVGQFRLTTRQQRTSDEYGIDLCSLVEHRDYKVSDVDAVIIASVVPDIMHSFGSAIIKYFGVKPLVVSAGVKTGLKIQTDNPRQIGADRIVDAVAAYNLYGGPIIVADFGTATTYDYVDGNGTYLYGVTSPGIRTAARSLSEKAAMLPEIEIKMPETILAKETISSMQAGVVYGYIGQTEYIINKMKEELGVPNVTVIATGGLGNIIANETDSIDVYNPTLTLEGLRMIYEKNKK
ncbi:MAG: type III pantothenate kinase [Eubacteriales bacterium]